MERKNGPGFAYAIIVAAGSGSRCPGPKAKQFLELGGQPLFLWSVQTFQECPAIAGIILVGPKDDPQARLEMQRTSAGFDKVVKVVAGGESRTASVCNGVAALATAFPEIAAADPVLVHDGVRPLLTSELIVNVAEQVGARQIAIPTTTPTATVKKIVGAIISETIPREELGLAQTPQGIPYGLLRQALDYWQQHPKIGITDESSLIENLPKDIRKEVIIYNVTGEPTNLKVTFPHELQQAESLLRNRMQSQKVFKPRQATGFGYDVHAFAADRKLILGGVEITGHTGLAGHSDADVLIHAFVDALLGAVGAGDIGRHFPDHDPAFKNLSSLYFLEQTLKIVRERGFNLEAADITVVAEQPKLTPHIPAMLVKLQQVIGSPCQLNIKATTSEGLGFTGRREGIAAYAVATVFAD
ncbi:MAG: 2-C-methyl-D-erythritol 2,4-cyclodiphosphate synthase [Deltaproteobacteria bacterium]|nr:2-C-methyl-D-erythritol 2,4-cyclodiphosphate synthase [Deltaproteobacteria bacterium]